MIIMTNTSIFPRDFLWGISMAAFQYEMGASTESIDRNSDWYVWLHDEKNISNNTVSGDFPENGPGYWDLFRLDHKLGSWLGLKAWRLNPEWSRIFPNPTKDVKVTVHKDDEGIKDIEITEQSLIKLDKIANKKAVEHYMKIFRDIKGRGIKLILNLYHWPLPLWIHDPIKVRDTNLREGPKGWVDEKTVVEFTKFAAYIAWKFGDLVDMWSTFNEPNVTYTLGYTGSSFPPGIKNYEGMIQAAINMIQTHARSYDQIKRILGKDTKVGLIYATAPAEPIDQEQENLEAANRANYIFNIWFFRAVIDGELDLSFTSSSNNHVLKRKDLKNKVDWIGVNYYTRNVVKKSEELGGFSPVPGYGFSCKPNTFSKANRPVTDNGWEIYPEGIRKALNIYSRYGKPLAITENGAADAIDRYRPWLLIATLHHVNKAIKEDNLNVFGYFHWSLLDNLEWAMGYKMRFGLFYVNMKTKERTPRPSAFIYKNIIEENGISSFLTEYTRIPNFLIGKIE